MRRRVLEVEMAGVGSLVRGYGSRELVESVTGRPPMWSHARKGWSCQQDTARDVVALAESRNYDVVMVGSRGVQNRTPAAPDAAREVSHANHVRSFTHLTYNDLAGGSFEPPAPQTSAPESEGGLW